jgi:hypothetical protein
VNSDGATVILQGKAVASGNLVLHGWTLSLDSWWTLDVVFYAIATALVGVRLVLLFAVPATIAALVVVVGVLMARRGRRGPAAAAGAITVVAILALPGHALASTFLASPIHVSTALYALIAFWWLRRNRFGWGWVLAVAFLAAGILGDLQMVAYGVVPALLAGLVAMLRRRSVRAGAAASMAAVCSVLLALVVREVVDLVGGFSLGKTNAMAPLRQMAINVADIPAGIGQLLGLGNAQYGSGGVPVGLQAVHAVAAALLLVCFVLALRGLFAGARRGTTAAEPPGAAATDDPEPWRLDDLLVLAAFGPMFDFVTLSLSSTGYLRYLTATTVFLTILAGRLVTRWWVADPDPVLRRRTVRVGAVAIACFVAACGVQLATPNPGSPVPDLVEFLEAHHLNTGAADFSVASLATVESDGRVTARPIVAAPDGKLEAYNKGEIPGWFAGVPFQFVVYPASNGANSASAVSLLTATRTWGAPTRAYSVAGYEVLLWSHPIYVTTYEPRLQGYPLP